MKLKTSAQQVHNTINSDETTDILNRIISETATKVIGFKRKKTKPWITEDILELCDKRRSLKSQKSNHLQEYNSLNKRIRKNMKKAKENCLNNECKDIDNSFASNRSKKAYSIIKVLTKKKSETINTILNKDGKVLCEDTHIIKRWTEYCQELYNYESRGDKNVLQTIDEQHEEERDDSILRDEVVNAIYSLKHGKAAGVDNIPAELITYAGEGMTDILHKICSNIWITGIWPEIWTKSLIITLPKKGNLQHCSNYRTISLISHASKVMLKIIKNRLQPQADRIIAEEQAGFMKDRSTIEQIFNIRILCEKHNLQQKKLYHIFIDFRKAFDRVWQNALWSSMKKYNIDTKLINLIQSLYEKASSAVIHKGICGDWFPTKTGVRQGCLLSPTLFNIFLEDIMNDALSNHTGSIKINGRNITNLRFADDIDGLAGSEEELINLTECLFKSANRFGMEINPSKTKLMLNDDNCQPNIDIHGEIIETVKSFKYLGSIINENGSRKEILSRAAQASQAYSNLKIIWNDKDIRLNYKLKLMDSLVNSIFLYACETWTLTAELEKRILAFEMKNIRKLLGITYLDRVTNQEIIDRISSSLTSPFTDILTTVKRRKLKCYGHVTRGDGLDKIILQGNVEGKRSRGRPKKQWIDNIKEWTGKGFNELNEIVYDRKKWRKCCFNVTRPHGSTG